MPSQVNLRDGALHALSLSGLARTQQGAVLLTTVYNPPLELNLKTIGMMPYPEIAKLYTVSIYSYSLGADICTWHDDVHLNCLQCHLMTADKHKSCPYCMTLLPGTSCLHCKFAAAGATAGATIMLHRTTQ